ncbi:MAG: hypothetical protein C0475_02685 [Planctomyces sp.]|nr:hypothetical protein [Planctomyces sp.]MBA4119104.1 hypothetical protein [Isosphaera sp.]
MAGRSSGAVTLARTVRFAVNLASDPETPPRGVNGYAGVPPADGFAACYELTLACKGPPDPRTGYFLDIKDMDRAARAVALPRIARACLGARATPEHPAAVLGRVFGPLSDALGGTLESLTLALSPYHRLSMTAHLPGVALVRHRFEFSAAHRLHAPSLSDEENRRVFGKCNHPAGHGHNYVFEPEIALELAATAGRVPVAAIEAVVHEAVIARVDHTFLNHDVPEFGPAGLNPSVENIAAVCFRWLEPRIPQRLGPGARLARVTVWETEKTSAAYPA